jgi:hypothetical protein
MAAPSKRDVRRPARPARPGPGAAVPPLALLAGLVALLAWSYAHLFAGEPHGLDNTAHLAEITFLADAMRAGDWDWWNPAGNSGFASGYFYQVLPQALTAALAALTGLAPLASFQLALFLPLLLAPVAAYRAVRVMGADPWVALGAAVALPFAIGGGLLTAPGVDAARWGHGADGALLGGLFTQLWAFVAFPLALAHAARWLETGRGLAAAVGWGLFVGLCHPFAGVALGAAALAGAAWRAVAHLAGGDTAEPGLRALLGRLVALGALMLAGSASAWLPVLVDYEGFGGFPARVADERGPGFVRLAGWVAGGHLLDHGRLPALTVLLPLVAIFARGAWLPWLWAPAAAYALVLGIGPHLGRTDDDLFPAVRFLGGLQMVLALAVGGGAVALARRLGRAGSGRARAGRPATVAGWLLVLPLAMVVVGGALTQRGRVKVLSDFGFIDRADVLRSFDAIGREGPGRLQVALGAECHWTLQLPYAYSGRPSVAVLGGAALQSSPNFVYVWELREADPARVARVFDAPLLLMRENRADRLQGGEIVWRSRTYQVRRFPAPGLVGAVQVVGELPAARRARREAVLRWLRSDLPDAGRVLADAGPSGHGAPPAGRALEVARGPSAIRARVSVDGDRAGPTTFAIRESWHPRWRATLDGAPVALRRITPDHMAVDVPPGAHVLELRFRRPLWLWLLWLLAPLAVLAARSAGPGAVGPLRVVAGQRPG